MGTLALVLGVAAVLIALTPKASRDLVRRWIDRLTCRRPLPQRNSLQEIARDVRRLGAAFRSQPRGQSFAKYEAHRRAYDDSLCRACQALDVTHLLTVIPPGAELDAERSRVEWELECRGLQLDLPLI